MRELLLLALGYLVWIELYGRGLVSAAPPHLMAPATPRADGAVDRIPDKLPRAIEYAKQAGTPPQDIALVAGFILTESAANPLAHNTVGEDSRGLMQVQVSTAQGLFDNGAHRFPRDQVGQLLFDPVIGVKIGYSFIEYLRMRVPAEHRMTAEDWVIRAYNGGERWHTKGARVASQTATYAAKVQRNIQAAETYLQRSA
ncbi:MAG: transglycosylase SLT domain-containing protein [Pseudomonadota bacterium]